MDVTFKNHGSIFTATLHTQKAKTWVADNVGEGDEITYWGGTLVIEHRYARDIADGMIADGLTVS